MLIFIIFSKLGWKSCFLERVIRLSMENAKKLIDYFFDLIFLRYVYINKRHMNTIYFHIN